MPTTFPPGIFVASDTLTPDLAINFARSEGVLIVTSRRSDPHWRGRITTPKLPSWADDNVRADFMAWLHWAVDLNMRVDFVHPKHRLPRHYTLDTWSMIGNATLESVPDLRTIVVSEVPVGTVLKRGDRLSINQGEIIVHRWIAEDVVTSSVLAQTIVLAPRLPIGVLVPGAAVVLKDPKMRFMIVPGSWDGEDRIEPAPVSFEVSESLR
jgi:hypothetical protein